MSIEGRKSKSELRVLAVCGCTVSGLGKGTTISSIGRLLKSAGYAVTTMKIDPYLNVDAGLMSPYEHGECFVVDDGGECDLDLGNYERFLDVELTSHHNMTTGKIFDKILKAERKGAFLGQTVQMVPHLTNSIVDWIMEAASHRVDETMKHAEILLLEIGGSVGDLESAVYFEALRALQLKLGDRFGLGLVTYLPVVGGALKTKPTQHGAKQLLMTGLKPDFLFCRCEEQDVPEATKKKISYHTMIPQENIFSMTNAKSPYQVPLLLKDMNFHGRFFQRFNLKERPVEMDEWSDFVTSLLASTVDKTLPQARIAFVGKYTDEPDCYISVYEAIKHTAAYYRLYYEIIPIDPQNLEADAAQEGEDWKKLKSVNAILIPGGFGQRGFEGKVLSAKYARENKIPFLGVCLGFQAATVEFARNVCKIERAMCCECDHNSQDNLVISTMSEHHGGDMGGTLRLGRTLNFLATGSLVSRLYGGAQIIYERHRHRNEVNPDFLETLKSHGLVFSGEDALHVRMGALELDRKEHPYFVGVQYHPEFWSRPNKPVPVFAGLLLAASGKLDAELEKNDGKLNLGYVSENQTFSHKSPVSLSTSNNSPSSTDQRVELHQC